MIVLLRVVALLMTYLLAAENNHFNYQIAETSGDLAESNGHIGGNRIDIRQSLLWGTKAFGGLRRTRLVDSSIPLKNSVNNVLSRVKGLYSFLLSGTDPLPIGTERNGQNISLRLAEAVRTIRNGAKIVCSNVWDAHFVNTKTGKVGCCSTEGKAVEYNALPHAGTFCHVE